MKWIANVTEIIKSSEAEGVTLRALLTRDAGARLVVHAWCDRLATEEPFLARTLGDLARASGFTATRYAPPRASAVLSVPTLNTGGNAYVVYTRPKRALAAFAKLTREP